MKVVVHSAFIVTGIFNQRFRLCCRAQVTLVGPRLRLSAPRSIQVARLLNRFDIRNCNDRIDYIYLYEVFMVILDCNNL